MIVGPLLARYGKARIPKPGGDKIGRRRLDTHFVGFQSLGAQFDYNDQDSFYNVTAKSLKVHTCYLMKHQLQVLQIL